MGVARSTGLDSLTSADEVATAMAEASWAAATVATAAGRVSGVTARGVIVVSGVFDGVGAVMVTGDGETVCDGSAVGPTVTGGTDVVAGLTGTHATVSRNNATLPSAARTHE
jgi:hypothetical protein